jgi:2-succinyl-5-enolpyruvyl-6-hydroxy-3-cyclohexene-1-carboxylate synthase
MKDTRTDIGLLNLRWAQAFADGFAAAGIADLVLSPGSRSTPLALAFLRQPAIRCHVILDERSAAFFALGIAKVSRRPTAVLCTSGSAPANWYPAIIESDADATPLLLLSADRPPELQGWGANQTIDQNHLFGRHVRAFHQPGAPHDDFSPDYLHRLAARAVSESLWPLPGPVHLNLAFREPLLPAGAAADWPLTASPRNSLPEIRVARGRLLPDADAIARLSARIDTQAGAIVCGRGDYPADFAEAVTALAGKIDCPILAEPSSNLRFGPHDRSRLCVRYEAFLRNPAFVAALPAQWVLRFGAFPIARTLQDWLSTLPEQFVVTPDSRWPDPQHRASHIVQADPTEFCRALNATELRPASAESRAAMAHAEAVAGTMADRYRHKYFEGALIPALLELLPAGHSLFCGNSMTIRDLDAFSGSSDQPLRIFCNRGASGIDGNPSTALGIATGGPCVALIGDLTAQHDLTALASTSGHDIVFVVLNNGGGGIFEYLPQAALPEFERAWLTPQRVDFATAARAFGVACERVESLDRFKSALRSALDRGGASLIEVAIERQTSVELHRRYWQEISRASLLSGTKVDP